MLSNLFVFILKYSAPHKKRIGAALFITILHVFLGLTLIKETGKNTSLFPFLIFFSLFVGVFFSFIEEQLLIPVYVHIKSKLSEDSFGNFLKQEKSKISIDNLFQVKLENEWLSDSISSFLRGFIKRIFQFTIFSGFLFFIDWRLSILSSILLPFILLPGFIIGRKSALIRKRMFGLDGKLNEFQSESVSNIDIIKGYKKYSYIESLNRSIFDDLNKETIKHNKLHSMIPPFSFSGIVLVGAAIYFYGSYLIQHNLLNRNSFLSFITGLSLLYPVLSGFSRDILLAFSFRKSKSIELISKKFSDHTFFSLTNSLELKNINFKYDDKLVFDNFSLKLKTGDILGIIGNNGTGKSTIGNIISGIESLDSGEILVDGKKGYVHFNEIGLLDQNGSVFTGDELLNIIFDRNFNLSENGAIYFSKTIFDKNKEISSQTISGGERRKVALDRALLGIPKLLILDEPEDSLDSDSIIELSKKLNSDYLNNSIIILITHNESLLALCNKKVNLNSNKM